MKENCHGCKWLDERKFRQLGCGYCTMVERSKSWKDRRSHVRCSDDERCELYEEGVFEKRFDR